MRTIYVDESGYTGADLLNRGQSVFVLASLCLDDVECAALKQTYFSRVRSAELKFSAASRSIEHQASIIAFLNHLATRPNLVKSIVCHKPYVLVTKIVDLLVETAAHSAGWDLYADEQNLSYTDFYFGAMPKLIGEDAWYELLGTFQDLTRLQSPDAVEGFRRLLNRPHTVEIDEFLAPLRIGLDILAPLLPNDGARLDLTLTNAMVLMARWRKEIREPITLIHDSSSEMARERDVWEALMDPNLEPAVVGYGDRTMAFPIAIEKTIAKESHTSDGLQLVDILAGALSRSCHWLATGRKAEDNFSERLANVVLKHYQALISWAVWPASNTIDLSRDVEAESLASPVDYISGILSRMKSN